METTKQIDRILLMDDTSVPISEVPHLFDEDIDFDKLKYPTVDNDGDVWLSKYKVIYWQDLKECLGYNMNVKKTTRKEEKTYWRYHNAWRLMNR